ncbi:MAG: N-acetyl sugar amidotransferase [Cytophagaceae bacterium]|nr:N-acetyl sugar amidotransferase [Cytophagaceae bacterium]
MNRPYQVCKRCIMDTTDVDITFDSNGICNHCKIYEKEKSKYTDITERDKHLAKLIEDIKSAGKGKPYNCVIGISGGVDSTYVAYKVKEWGLKPIAVHLDNGWDSELAVKNIENIIQKLNFDLYTHVIDWEEFKDIQLAYLKASVLDLEAPSDHAIMGTLYKMANKYGIKYILAGTNHSTEGILPESFRYSFKTIDATNIKAIHKKFGTLKKLKTFPFFGLHKYIYFQYINIINYVSPLNYLNYNKKEAKETIIRELDWKDYGGKHYESIITRFYQGYILPRKFNIDKRIAHLSTLICSNQITREQALEEMKKDIYDPATLKSDLEYVPKKFGLTMKELEEIIKLPPKNHLDYPNEKKIFDKLLKLKQKYFR